MSAARETGEPVGLTATLVAFAMVAFAANSLLCRMTLGRGLIDPLSFTTVRLLSGTLVLVSLRYLSGVRRVSASQGSEGSWRSALALFGYAATFSMAYVSLETGTGALILFGAVQATMIGAGLRSGERLRAAQWLGFVLAAGGLAYLTVPGATAPDPVGALLMLAAGVAWGVYSLFGRRAQAPVRATTTSFVRALPLALLASVVGFSFITVNWTGLLLATASGAVASGLGYVVWYRALRGLTRTLAAVVQLLVPVLASFGGVVFLGELVSLRLVVASVLILGGVAMAVVSQRQPRSATS